MTRQIKFRAYQVKDKEMYQPFDGYLELTQGKVDVVGFSDGDIRLEGDDVILMQFTGLLDKNGKEIYEGDIVKREGNNYDPYIVAWSDIGSCFVVNDLNGGYMDWLSGYVSAGKKGSPRANQPIPFCEIIGNIYEHPHLLTSEVN